MGFVDVSIEAVRKFWDDRPCNVRHSEIDIDADPLGYSIEVSMRRHFVEPHWPRFLDYERWRGKRVLEIGCGIGTDAIEFALAGARVTAMDLSSRSLEIALKRAGAHGLNIEFVLGDAEELPCYLEPRSYDLVYSVGVLHHTPHPERAVRVIRDYYMRPGSVLKLMLYHRWSWKVFWIIAGFGRCQFWKLDELVAKYSEAQTGCPVTYTFTRESARKLLRGFCVKSTSVDFIFPYRIPDYIEHRYVKEWYWRWMPGCIFRWLERRIGWHLLIEAKKR